MQARFYLAVFSLLLTCSFSQAQQYVYRSYTAADGLPSSEIISLAKDEKDFLWCGTSAGISRFDGYGFTNFNTAADGSKIGYVNCIRFIKGQMLLGTTAGLFCRVNSSFVKLSAAISGLSQSVNDILLLSDNATLFLATANGPVKINWAQFDFTGRNSITLHHYLLPGWGNTQTGDNKIATLVKEAADGTVYFAGNTSLYRISSNTAVFVYKLQQANDKILSIFPVSSNKVYIDASATEINIIENSQYTSRQHETLYRPGAVNDDNKAFWYLGTMGLYYFHPLTGIASKFINTMDHGVPWPSAMLEEDNFFWVASHDGLVKISPVKFSVYDVAVFSETHDFYSFLETPDGHFYSGSNRGQLFEIKDNLLTRATQDQLVTTAELRAMQYDGNSGLWFASGYQGLVLLQKGSKKNFTEKDGLHDNSLNSFLLTGTGKLFVVGDAGITEIISNGNSVQFKPYHVQPVSTKYGKFFTAIEGPDGTIWVGGEEGLFYLQGGQLLEYKPGNRQFSITCIIKDRTGTVWMATEGDGILQCRFNSDHRPAVTAQYNDKNGAGSQYYLTLLADNKNNIWAGSSKGITFIGQDAGNSGRVLNFSEADGFIKTGYNYIQLYQDKKGLIWAATIFGIASFDPAEITLPAKALPVYITSVSSLKSGLYLADTSILHANAPEKFAWHNNALGFAFTALDYANAANLAYYYRLDGLDSNWIANGNQRSINYENLPPGRYTFRVKAVNNKGVWSAGEATYTFEITKPFWLRGWFIIIALLLLLAVTYNFIRRREKRIRERENQKTALQKLKADSYQHQLEMEQVVNYFATAINEKQTVDEMLWDVAKNCISRLGFEDCVIYLKDDTRNVLVQKAAWGPKTTDENKIINPIEIPLGKGVVGTVAVTGKAEIIGNTMDDERYIMDDTYRFSEIAVPVIDEGQTIGVIDSEHPEKNFYTGRHLQILTTIASLVGEKMGTIRAEQATRQKEIEVLKLNKNLATSQLTALRAQMNPHFIFNALNSVQQYILQGNVDEANKYLSKFSRLQREILHNSDQQFIPLDKEKEMLELYLQLERLRFNDSFSYEITFDEDLDTDEIMVPPMIIQPFVENAIWHGLMPKEGEKKLAIAFAPVSDSLISCTITDNGIGRNAAAANKQQLAAQHKSRGLSLVYERLRILETQFSRQFSVSIQDLRHNDGTAAGTRISLVLFTGM